MNSNPLLAKLPDPVRRYPVLAGVAALVVLLLGFLWLRPASGNGGATAYHEVKRGDFTVSVVEGGTLGAVNEVVIRNEVEGTARIIRIVPEGAYVKKGDLLVELDSAQAQDQVNQQQINVEKAAFAVTNALAQLQIQRSATNTDYTAAKLKLELAKLDLEKYKQGQRLVNLIEASNKVIQAQAQLAVNMDTWSNSVALAAKGYETKMKVDGDGLSVTNTLNALVVATNNLWMLQAYDIKKELATYEAAVRQAEEDLERVVIQNEQRMAQYEADLTTQKRTLELSQKKLERDERNLQGTKIYAPQDGLVVYAVTESHFSSESLIEEGATVRNRQELIKLPDLSQMKVSVKVHESHINMVRPGLPAYVVLDSAPDERFAAVVERVAPLPDTQSRWGNPNLKVYATDVYLTETIPNVKPGVSAKAEILITNISNTVSVPIQAVTTYKGKQVVYLVNGRKSEPKPVETGLYNTKFIQITQGLNEGDRVLLSPPFDVQEKDLEGAVLAEDEKTQAAKTNFPARVTSPTDLQTRGARRQEPPSGADQFGAASGPAGDFPGAETGGRDGQGRGGGFNFQEMTRQYDKNGDGELDESEREAMRAAMMARFGGAGGPGGLGEQAGPRFNREAMLKQYDTNGDGELDDSEREAMRAAFSARFGGQRSGGQRLSREEMLKQYDTNGDGELGETQRAAMRAASGGGRGSRTSGDRQGDGTSQGEGPARSSRDGGNGNPAPRP